MPLYCYMSDDESETVERLYPMGRAPKRIRLKGRGFFHDVAADHRGRHWVNDGYPKESLACGCNPKQNKQFWEESVKRGVPTKRADNGNAIFETRQHQNQYLRAFGMCNWDAGYGDAAPLNC